MQKAVYAILVSRPGRAFTRAEMMSEYVSAGGQFNAGRTPHSQQIANALERLSYSRTANVRTLTHQGKKHWYFAARPGQAAVS